jgi:hypothetical protein
VGGRQSRAATVATGRSSPASGLPRDENLAVRKADRCHCETDWGYHEYAGIDAAEQEKRCGLRVDQVRLPADEKTRI